MRLKALLPLLLCCCAACAADYQLQTLEKAHTLFHSATNAAMYAEAARQYGFLVEEEGIRNGELYYTLGNTWLLAGDLGRAILNYRRAEQYLPHNADVRNNLRAALEQRVDLIPAKERAPLVSTLLGWHFNTPAAFRWRLFAGCWLLFWCAWIWNRKTRAKESRITVAATAVLCVALAASLLIERVDKLRTEPGVILAPEVLARKGNGEIYAPAFLDPLHAGTEFEKVEVRGQWWRIRLADGQECWIPAHMADTVAL